MIPFIHEINFIRKRKEKFEQKKEQITYVQYPNFKS